MRKWITFLIVVTVAWGSYKYLYKDHRDIDKEEAVFKINSSIVNTEFSNDLIETEKKYLNKTIEISGDISEITENDLTLDGLVFCLFTKSIESSIKLNAQVTIKGRCIGYDDLLEQVKLDQCTIIH